MGSGRDGAVGCAMVRRATGEGLQATAPERAASWLLVEHPGPWPAHDLPPDLPPGVTAVLEAATAADVRPQLIRRVRNRRHDDATVIVASCRPGRSWLERRTVRDLRVLADLDLAAVAAGRPPGFGVLAAETVVLVCTHVRRDVCCARLGRPLAVLLDQQLPGQVWETTHVGGDRFAPNVVALPDGSYHGGLALPKVPALAAALTSGRVLLPALRGRAGLPVPVQAADQVLRDRLGLGAVADVQPLVWRSSPSGKVAGEVAVEVAAELPGGRQRWRVRVRPECSAVERLTSCDGTVERPSSYVLVGAERLT